MSICKWLVDAMRARNIPQGQGFPNPIFLLQLQIACSTSNTLMIRSFYCSWRAWPGTLNKCEMVTRTEYFFIKKSIMSLELTPKVCLLTSCDGALSILYLVMYLSWSLLALWSPKWGNNELRVLLKLLFCCVWHIYCVCLIDYSSCCCHWKSKMISNDQELIQSDPISCPQNQKGNN